MEKNNKKREKKNEEVTQDFILFIQKLKILFKKVKWSKHVLFL